MVTFSKLYKKIYEHNSKNSDYINNFKKNPYSYIKARYYFITANLIVYYVQNYNFNPRLISFLYIFQGIIAMIFLNFNNIILNMTALFLFFSKGTLDWSDGHYARLKNKTSITGHILDVYGARLNSTFFLIGFGFYQYQKYNNDIFIYMVILIPLLTLGYFEKYAYQLMFINLKKNKLEKTILDKNKKNKPNVIDKHYKKYKKYFINFLDDRSRTIDLILLFLLIEIIYNFSFTFIIFFIIFFKWLVIWLFSLFFHTTDNWSEKIILNKENEIDK
tara:strand:+ start:20989 stop:21813 length:825 start_codon:yes stop_codon:yes gene_type:complete